MTNKMWNEIARAYEPIEANRCVNWQQEYKTLREIANIAYEIQDQQKFRPGECRYWTALWVKRVRLELGVPAVQVGGDLFAYGDCIYRCPDQSEFLDSSSAEFEQHWAGHSWLALGDFIGDISLTITAMDNTCQLTLKQAVEEHFTEDGAVIRVLGFTAEDFQKRNLLYVPKGVYSHAAIEKHIEVGKLSDKKAGS